MRHRSFYEATARQRIVEILDAHSFAELVGPEQRTVSPHMQALQLPVAFDALPARPGATKCLLPAWAKG